MKSCKLTVYLLLLAGCFASCSKSGGEAGPDKKPVPYEHGTPQGAPVTKTIGPAGGTLQTPEGNISVEIPAGAVSAETNFSIQAVSKTLESATGTAYRLRPENVEFKKDVKITFRYTDDDLIGTTEDDLYLAFQNAEGYWDRFIMTEIDKSARKLHVQTKHFSDWTIERVFWIENHHKKTSLRAGEDAGFLVYFSDKLNGDKVLNTALVPDANVETWFVNGPGTFNHTNANACVYTAPASIQEPKEIAIGVRIRNMVSKRHPDRAGNAGLAIVQVPIQLVPDEYFIWEIDGTEHVAHATDAALLGTTTNIMGTGLTGNVSLFVNATKPGSYDVGSAVEPEKFNAQVGISGATAVIYLSTYYVCGESGPRYGSGKLTIVDYGSIGNYITGYFATTVYTPVSDCQQKSKVVSGSFRIRRKA
ncbi:hypothetical protein WJU16_21870 [Chitinophaga pollutisoli]|uniref:ZU5 domain-containing protein n=1 Tax=Chitinophaga pollutisoli TaxID=3133966 RepID=A0ABZ2YM16_9BACT